MENCFSVRKNCPKLFKVTKSILIFFLYKHCQTYIYIYISCLKHVETYGSDGSIAGGANCTKFNFM